MALGKNHSSDRSCPCVPSICVCLVLPCSPCLHTLHHHHLPSPSSAAYVCSAGLAGWLHDQVLNLSLHPSGCRVVQKALEKLPQDMKPAIIQELELHVMKCVQDQHGNHVVQKCVEQVRQGSRGGERWEEGRGGMGLSSCLVCVCCVGVWPSLQLLPFPCPPLRSQSVCRQCGPL